MHRVGNADLTSDTAGLGRQHAEHVRPHPSHREAREPLRIAWIGEFDLSLDHLGPAGPEHVSRSLEHLECLPRVAVVEQQNPWPLPAGRVCHKGRSSSLRSTSGKPSGAIGIPP